MIKRGDIWWAELDEPRGSFRHPVLILQSDAFNRSAIETVIVAVLSTNLRLAHAPGNVLIEGRSTGLPKRSVLNVSQVLTIDRECLAGRIGRLTPRQLNEVEDGLRLVLSL